LKNVEVRKKQELFQIEFHATRGENEFGYVAIDDITFAEISDGCTFEPPDSIPTTTTTETPETTTTTTTTTTTLPSTTEAQWSYCTFQTGLCGWIIDQVTIL
jgi:hypothetical protein